MVVSNDWFGYKNEEDKITGAINYPFNSSNQSGYIFYRINIPKDGLAGANIVNYIHYNHPFRIPYVETEHRNLMFSDNMIQHHTNFTTSNYRE